MNTKRNNRKPKPPVDASESPKVVESVELSSPEVLVPGPTVEEILEAAEKENVAQIAKLKKELADANSVLGRQRGDLETLRAKADADKKVIAGLKTELNKLNAFGRWLYGIKY